MSQAEKRPEIALPKGLAAATLDGLKEILRDLTGADIHASLFFAPSLVTLLPEVARHLPLPAPVPGLALVHDYQSVRFTRPLPADTALTVKRLRKESGLTTELEIDILGFAQSVTAVRQLPERELSGAAPLRMRPLETGPTLVCRTAHVEGYLQHSRDPNMLHRDVALARALGFAAPVVPGLLLAGLIQPAVEAAYPTAQVTALRVRFAAPVQIDQPLQVALQPRGETRLRAFVLVKGGAAAIVDLELAPQPEP